MIDLDSSVEIPADVLVRIIDGEAVLLNLDDENYYGLDDVSTEFWQAITEKPTLQAAVDSLVGTFEVDEATLRADFETFVTDLVDSGLLHWAQARVTV